MNKKIAFLMVVVLLVGALPFTFAQDDDAVTVIEAGGMVKIGIATDLSNFIPAPGQDIANGAILAIEQFNEAGGVQGFMVEYDLQDDRCVGEDATTVANRFVADPALVGVVGHACSGASVPASNIYAEANIVQISASSTAAALTNRGLLNVNRTTYSDAIQGIVAARYMASEMGATTVALMHDNQLYGAGLVASIKAELELLGVEIVAEEVIDPEEQDYRPQLTEIAANPPDVLYFGGYTPQAALLVEQMKEVGLESTAFFAADGIFSQEFIDLAGDNANGVYASIGSAAVEGDEELVAAYNEAYEARFDAAAGELGPFNDEAYDAANIILSAIASVATVDADGNLVIDRVALQEAVRATEGFPGVSGPITCDDTGECGTTKIGMNLVEDGAWVELEVPDELQVTAE
jgi:branched-chain amino acid transport system substrate-binding protein